MRSYAFGIAAFAFMLLLAGQQSAVAQAVVGPQVQPYPDPAQEVFDECVQSLRHLVARCDNANADTVHEAIRRITDLLNQGKRKEARIVAARAIAKVENTTDLCIEEAHERCRRCVNALVDLNAPELARELVDVCKHVVRLLGAHEERAINAIKGAFP